MVIEFVGGFDGLRMFYLLHLELWYLSVLTVLWPGLSIISDEKSVGIVP